MALTRKHQHLYDVSPDIAIIPECARNCVDLCIAEGWDGRWIGDNPQKGLGILVAKPWRIGRMGKARNKWVIPVWIRGGSSDFLLLAVWAMDDKSSTRAYIGQIREALNKNLQWFSDNEMVIVAGDFNSNKIWDVGDVGDHSAVVNLLAKNNLVSAYHHFFSESQGEETRPTHYHSRWKKKPYHVDYVFVPERWTGRMKNVDVGERARWSSLSDHMPLTVDVMEP